MAFPIPDHLPRKQDVSSKILTKLDNATNKSLNASLANEWLEELDQTILLTKKRIHERIHQDLPAFEQQVASSKSVQERLHSLTSNVDRLNDTLSNTESGLVPSLLRALTTHAALAQRTQDTTTTHSALTHLHRCKSEFEKLESLVQAGKLPEAVTTCESLNKLLGEAPIALSQANIMGDMKRRYRALKDRTEEQLSDAYTESIIVTPSEITIRSSVQIRQSSTILSLSSILSSLSSTSLPSHLTTLRRDLTTHYIDHILSQPSSITVTNTHLQQFPSPPNSEDRSTRLSNLTQILSFLQTHLFPSLPASQKDLFPKTLCKPLTHAILHKLLIPNLPSSLSALKSGFLALLSQAVEFEEEYVVGVLGGGEEREREIKAWAEGIVGHYERKRRMEVLAKAREVIVDLEGGGETFEAEVKGEKGAVEVVPVQEEEEEDAWGLDGGGEAVNGNKGHEEGEENGWGFDDEEEEAPIPAATAAPLPSADDPADAWGWNDEEEPVEEEDDPWAEQIEEPAPAPPPSIPKPATRLEKHSAKGKTNGVSSSPSPAIAIQTPPAKIPEKRAPPPPQISTKQVSPPKETYLVSGRTQVVIRLVEDALSEAREFASSNLFPTPSSSSSAPPGTLISQSALSILDLYRALYPVIFGSHFTLSSELAMRFSNDCLYLSEEATRISEAAGNLDGIPLEKLHLCRDNLKVLGESWYMDTIGNQRQANDEILAAAEGFTDTGDQDRYDVCEDAIMRVIQEIRSLAPQWKSVLAKSKYYVALGSLADAALSRVLNDILALDDITEVESHRLSELCKILNALESLFVEDTTQPSFVVAYVPSWLKYSYLSELLEASIADISYLFQEGALVDFKVEELVKLVRALFADTPLRTNTINKLMSGHPVPQGE